MAFKAPWNQDDYHTAFAAKLAEQIRAGTAPWQKPWQPGERSTPENFKTEAPYRGGNSVYLAVTQAAKSYSENRWGTYKQISDAGGQVRKGEKGTPVLFFDFDTKREKAMDEQGQPVKDKHGKQVYNEVHQERQRPFVRTYTVFNVEQADGLRLERRGGAAEPEWKTHQNAELVIRESGVPVTHVNGDRAYYNMAIDRVTLPEQGQFPTANAYYQTALHELGHATGHPRRMDRATLQAGIKEGFGSEAYAREELRAEMSAMMTGDRVGVGHDGSRGAAYVESWLKVLDKEPQEMYRAASEAQKISDYLVQPMRDRSTETEKQHGELAQKYAPEHGPRISHTPAKDAPPAPAHERDAGMSR